MNFGPKSIASVVCLCFSSALAMAQGTACGDGGAPAQGSPIACVTGDGVQVTAASAPAAATTETLPLTPEQRPAAAPMVTYVGGKLSVVAKNSTLGDVLRTIAAKIGASIDVPEGANERVVSQLGPAPAHEVIAGLLNGSHYNYVMVGTETNPDAVVHVILTAKSDRPEGSAPVAPNATMARGMVQPRTALQAAVMEPYQRMLEQQQAQQEAAAELQQQVAESVQVTGAPVSTDAVNAAVNAPGSDTASDASATQPADAARNANSNEKTPQQLLQNMYETRRQMIEQQKQPPTPPQQ